jgi:hypothetical protein
MTRRAGSCLSCQTLGITGRSITGLGLGSLRSAPNVMHVLFPASFHSGKFVKHTARFSRHQTSGTKALTRCYASRPSFGSIQAVLSTLRPETLSARRGSARSQSVGAAGYGSSSSAFAGSLAVMSSQSRSFTPSSLSARSARDAQLRNREDVARQAGRRLSSLRWASQ